MRSVGGARQDEAWTRLRRQKAGPFPAEVVTPVPPAPIVIVVGAGAVESSRHASRRPVSGNAEARDGVPGDPSVAEGKVLLDETRLAVRRGSDAAIEAA